MTFDKEVKAMEFSKYEKMIEKKAWEISKKTGVDVEELKAQAALIYCNTLERYDISKSSFSTIFYLSLNQLYEYAYYFRDRKRDNYLSIEKTRNIEFSYDSPKLGDFLVYAKKELSENAYKVMEFILSHSWDFKGRNLPNVSLIMREFNFTRVKVKKLWDELSDFWNKDGIAFYA